MENVNWTYPISFALVASGFLLPLWPLCIAGILLAAFFERYLFAVAVAVLVDLGFGAPTGLSHYLFFPFTAVALTSIAARIFLGRYLIDKTPPETL